MKHTLKEAAEILQKYDLPNVAIGGSAINELIEASGILKKDLAELMHVSQPAVSSVKNAKTVRPQTLKKYLSALGITEKEAKTVLGAALLSGVTLYDLLELDDVSSCLPTNSLKTSEIKRAVFSGLERADIKMLEDVYEYIRMYEMYHGHKEKHEQS